MVVIAASAVACAPNGFGNAADSDSDRATGADQGAHAATRSEQNAGAMVQGVATFTAADAARIVLVLEQSSIAQARLAEQRATTMEVKTYASRMIRERTEAMERLAAILERTVPRSEDPTPPLFEQEITRSREWLMALDGGFDLPFMTAEIGAHARLLGMLDVSLLPSAARSSDEVQEELLAVRNSVAAQMVHALRVQGVLRAGNAPVEESTSSGSTEAAGLVR